MRKSNENLKVRKEGRKEGKIKDQITSSKYLK